MQSNSILFISYWYPNKSNENSAIFIKRHAQAIQSSNTPIIVLALNIIHSNSLFKKNTIVFKDEEGLETHQIYIESKFYKLIYVLLPLHYFIIKSYINKQISPSYKFNIIHSNILFPCGIVGYWLAKKYNCKHIISEHWSKLDKFFKVSLWKSYGKKALNRAHSITCVSGLLKETIKKHTTNNSISIIPNAVNSSQFYFDSNITKNTLLTFIAVAHWTSPKNPFYFLEALQHLYDQQKLPDFKLVLVGNGSQIDIIKQRNFKFEIEYKGNLTPNNLRDELNKSHLFLHGSDFETFSVIIAEALMCGLPCVVSPVGIAHEVINDFNGFISNNAILDWQEKISSAINKTYNYKSISNQLKNKYDSNTIGKLFYSIYC
jgi:glycosyltransferase involved in cell wall biosynthesis